MNLEILPQLFIGALVGGLANSLYSERKVGQRLQRLETIVAVIAGKLKIETD